MKIRATLAALIITAAIAPAANATLYPMAIGPEGTEVRREIIDMGFGCTKIKESSFTCLHKNKKVTISVRLIGGTSWPTSSHLGSLQITSHLRSGQPWLKNFIYWMKPSEREHQGKNIASWVYQSCAKDGSSYLSGEPRIWGKNFSITGSDKACTLRIWGYFT
jgi:hypothetical protein